MSRFFSGIFLFLMSFLARAVEPVVYAPTTSTDPTAMIVFAILLLGMVVGFFYFVWRNEQKRKQQETADK